MRRLLAAIFCVVAIGCMKRAPTNYELDRRAGLGTPPAEATFESERKHKGKRKMEHFNEPIWSNSTVGPIDKMPARTNPIVAKVWVSDQKLSDGSWLQGTWLFMEVLPSQWLFEVDPGGGPFVE